MDRRHFLKYSAAIPAALPLSGWGKPNIPQAGETHPPSPVCMFVKPLEKYSYDDIAVILSESGFDGADISLRKGGLIDPETARTELPGLIKIFERRKLSIPMAVSGISSPFEPDAERLIRLMADCGIKYYRLGAILYDKTLSIPENLNRWKEKMMALCELNARYGVHGAIQNHAGTSLGAPVWDAYCAVKDCDPRYMGIQYDIRHAMAEGMSSWPLALEMALGHIRTTCIKDFTWIRQNKGFKPLTVPLGEGIVDFGKYFGILNSRGASGPVSIHYEYPLLPEEQSGTAAAEQVKSVISNLTRDLDTYKHMFAQSLQNNNL
ncbi:MAG: TIM barrel protein [Tannerellaceae bacterium]|jgi:sugar phosphate isomerase/epimerase|nr:TIM barrel protein [Tannerellaceae bacterium]